MSTNIVVVDGAVGLTPDMLRQPARQPLSTPPTEGAIVMSTIPSQFRGSAMESHTGWPRTWEAPDAHQASIVAEQLQRLIRRSGFPEQFAIDVHDLTVTVDRTI